MSIDFGWGVVRDVNFAVFYFTGESNELWYSSTLFGVRVSGTVGKITFQI